MAAGPNKNANCLEINAAGKIHYVIRTNLGPLLKLTLKKDSSD